MTTLAELRLANMREQKKSASEPAAPVASAPVPEIKASPEVVVAPPPSDLREDDLVLSQYLTDAAPAVNLEPVIDSEAEKSAALIARVQSMLAHKTLHPNGAKATVDMSPALFHRAKRYCLDHGNVTLRQLFLDLMTAFLDEEGY
ncbi:MAG: hypothetical protein ACRYFS_26470 [Janthinobacterium lividum]